MWESVVEAVAAGTGASISVAVLARRWFRQAVQDVVDKSIGAALADVIKTQKDAERRQGAHLDRQDARLERIEQKLNRR